MRIFEHGLRGAGRRSKLRLVPRAHVLLVESIHDIARELLSAAEFDVHTASAGLGEAELIQALNGLPGEEPVFVGIRSKTKVREAVFDAVPRLAGVGAFCIGTDQIDLRPARDRGIAVFNAPFSNTRSVAELVIAEIVMLSRQIPARSRAAHEGRWLKSASGAHEVRGKSLGIVGYGHIGSQLSVLAESLGLRVRYYDVVNKLPLGNAEAVNSLDALLAESDFVSLHVPDTANTRDLFDRETIAKLKPGSYLINASRGKVVDLEALADALREGRVKGAAIDVYPQEPKAKGDAFATPLQGIDNVILTPHIGGSTEEAQANIGREVASAIGEFVRVGRTTGCLTLPEVDAPLAEGRSRVFNVHQNVPGVLSAINQAVADSGLNIVGQQLSTREELGLLLLDLDSGPGAAKVRDAVAALPTSLRTRLL